MDKPEGRTRRGAPAENARAAHLRLCRYMLAYRGLFAGVVALLLLSLAIELCIPQIIERAVNAVCPRGGAGTDLRALVFSLGMLTLVILLNAACGCVQEILSAKITLNMALSMRRDAFSSLMDGSYSDFSRLRNGDMMSRIVNDTELAAGVYTECFRELFSAAVIVIGCAVIMLVKSARLACVPLGIALVSALVMGALGRHVLPAFTRRQTALGEMNAHIEESLKTFRSCTAGGRTEENLRRMKAYNRDYYRSRLRAGCLENLMEPIMLLLGNVMFLLTMLLGVRSVIAGTLTVGALQAFNLYSRQFVEPINALSEYYVRSQAALAGAERVFRIIDRKSEREQLRLLAAPAEESPRADGEIAFRDVAFAYRRNHPVLRGIDLRLDRGERLALVGRTGEGKTTLTDLLLLLWPHYTGEITVGGTELKSMDPAALRRLISVVPQQPQLIRGSVYENLIYGCENARREDAEAVVRSLSLDRLLARLPKGLDTELKEAEENMSQGELQLICLARALLRQSDILVLDEATSSLDPDTEERIGKGMEAAMAGRTCIIIAHRLSSVRNADHIAVLSDGVIAEYGDHESLMARGGLYHSLYCTQFLGEET